MTTGKSRIADMVKKGYDTPAISGEKYNLIIGAVLAYGFLMNILTCTLAKSFVMQINPLIILATYLILVIAGSIIAAKSNKPIISFLGYNMIVLPMGAVLTLYVDGYDIMTVRNAFIITSLVTLIMIGISTAFPNAFIKLGRALFIALIVVIVAELIMAILSNFVSGLNMSAFDYIIAGLFSLYIGYDWSIAQAAPKTVDNAVDSALGLYLDIINLFIRILSILGKRK